VISMNFEPHGTGMAMRKPTGKPGRRMKASLARYRKKRDFAKTAEPRGHRRVSGAKQLRFVIQKHAARNLHYDLRLELNGVFKSWAVTRGPSIDPSDKRLAVEVEDHPLDYGDFEGTIPKGQYGGGTVQLWDRGYWKVEGNKSPEEALKSGDLKFTLAGKRLKGSWVLVRMKNNRYGNKRTNWLLIKHRDAAAEVGEAQALLDLDRSVASGRSMSQIAAGKGKAPTPFMLAKQSVNADAVWGGGREDEREGVSQPPATAATGSKAAKAKILKSLPTFIEPQLCRLVDRPPAEVGWGHEVKFDGYRAQLRVLDGEARIRTRRGLDWTARFAAIAKAAKALPDCIIDGEVCALDQHQVPSFASLQAALSENQSDNLIIFAFDLLVESKNDLRPLPLAMRKQRLQALIEKAGPGDSIRYAAHFESAADTVLQSACRMHLEGIVSKRLDAPYISGRSGDWTKAKCRGGHEVVLGGWSTEAGRFRSLLAGVNRDGHLVYVGRIGTGYGSEVAAKLVPTLEKLTREKSPFGGKNAPPDDKSIRWLKPSLVAEIEFAGWTASGMIRQASFKGLRRDKPAREVIAEMPTPLQSAEDPEAKLAARVKGRSTGTSGARTGAPAASPGGSAPSDSSAVVMGVSVSKPAKALWPNAGDRKAVTKLDLAHYFEAVGEWLLAHLKGRPCSLVRAPDGIAGEQFFQRHAMAGASNLFTLVKVKGDKAPYVQIDRIEALITVAQIGALEIHPWNCAPDDPEVAGRLVFDLDPGADVKFSAIIAAAHEIRERLKTVGLESFCKTSGGKGLHVVAPLIAGKEAVAWPAAKDFAHVICSQMAQDSPTRYVDTMSKRERVGRIFLDYLRNDRTSTAVAVMSPRARPGAMISMPLHWKDVRAGLDPARYTVRTGAAALRKSNAWDRYKESAGSLRTAIRKATQRA
jgi:bifunctional non-homologous end joining protein LigD